MKSLQHWFGGLAALVVGSAAWAQQDFSTVEITTQQVAPGIYMLQGLGGNIGVSVGDDGVTIIDDQFGPLAPKIRSAITALSDKPIRFVINTHWHGDHTGGNEAFGSTGSIIVAQDNVRRRMSVDQLSGLSGTTVAASPAVALPVVTFTEGVTLHWNGDDLEVFHVANAHTDGDAIIRFRRANVVHMGDTYFQGLYPFIDTSSGGSVNGFIGAINQVLPTVDDSTRIIPGHGPLSSKAELVEYRNMLVTVRDRIAKMVKEGKSQDEVIAAQPTKDFDPKWGGGFLKPDVWVGRIYVDLKRDAAMGSAP